MLARPSAFAFCFLPLRLGLVLRGGLVSHGQVFFAQSKSMDDLGIDGLLSGNGCIGQCAGCRYANGVKLGAASLKLATRPWIGLGRGVMDDAVIYLLALWYLYLTF